MPTPKEFNARTFLKGFTLIELMVVIAILAVLSTVGLNMYRGVTKSADDAKKKADINAIASAYEANYDLRAKTYRALTEADFTNGSVPKNPDGTNYQFVIGPGLSSPLLAATTPSTRNFQICATLQDSSTYCRDSARGSTATVGPATPTATSGPVGPTATMTPTPPPFPSSGLAAYWKMDETSGTAVADNGGAHNGTTVRDPGVDVGRIIRGRSLNGNGQFITIPNHANLQPSTVSVAGWVKLNDNSLEFLISKGSTCGRDGHGGWHLRVTSTAGFVFYTGPSYRESFVNGTTILGSGRWYHLAATFDGQVARLYVDGVQEGTVSIPVVEGIDYVGGAQEVRVGLGWSCDPVGYLNGVVDEVGVWRRALTPAEVTNLYNRGNGLQP